MCISQGRSVCHSARVCPFGWKLWELTISPFPVTASRSPCALLGFPSLDSLKTPGTNPSFSVRRPHCLLWPLVIPTWIFSLLHFSFCAFLYWWGLHYFIWIHYFFKVCLTLIYLLQKMNLVWTEFWWCSCGWVGKKMRHDPSLTFLKRLQYPERLGDLKNVKQLSSPLSGTAEFLDLF